MKQDHVAYKCFVDKQLVVGSSSYSRRNVIAFCNLINRYYNQIDEELNVINTNQDLTNMLNARTMEDSTNFLKKCIFCDFTL